MATASDNPNVSVQEMEEDLSCCICYNLLQDPRDLECPHVYCLACLQSWVGEKPTIECPECRYITIVPQGGLENLKSNLRLKGMVEKYSNCIEKQKSVPLCPDHDGERQHFYCMTCKTTVCHNCLVLEHQQPQHNIKELKVITKSKKDEIKGKMGAVREQTNKSKEREEKLSDAEMKLKAATDKAKQDIKKHVQEMICKVNAKGDDMMQIVENTHQKQMNLLKQKQNHAKDYTTRLENAQSATQNVLDSTPNHVYMAQHAALVDRMDRLCLTKHEAPDLEPPQFNPAYVPYDSNWFGLVCGNTVCRLKLVHEFGQFKKAQGIAANQDGLVAVVDADAKKTEVFQSNGDEYESKFCLKSNVTGINDTENKPYRVCVATDGNFCLTTDNYIRMFSSTGKYLRSVQSYSSGSIAASPDGTIITGHSHKQSITLLKCDCAESEVMKTYNIDQNVIESIVSNGTQIVYTTGSVGKVCAIDFKTGQALWYIDVVFPLGICYEPKSNTLLVAGGTKGFGDNVINQYCSATGRLISRLATGLHNPLALTVTQDNKLLVSDMKTVKVYEIQ